MCSLRKILVLGIWSLAGSVATEEPQLSVESFRRATLPRQFDADKDGRLNDRERAVLRAAFGGVDVPMLPQRPEDYTTVRLPKHVDTAEFAESDNSTEQNLLTNDGAALDRVLFHDTQLSRNHTVSCAMCHEQRAGFSDPKPFSVGFDRGRTGRNSMGLANLRYTNLKGARPGFFRDERAASLEARVLMPIQDRVEMGMELKELEVKILESLQVHDRSTELGGSFRAAPLTLWGSRRSSIA
jgi:hypothetical protein